MSYSWIDKGSYWLSNEPQPSEKWKDLRVGRITMSTISKLTLRSSYKDDPIDVARCLLGLSPLKVLTQEQIDKREVNFARGHKVEAISRDIYSKKINMPIAELGLAVWKEDMRFGASLDGEIRFENGEIHGVEFKAPATMYKSLIEHIEAIKKGFTPPPGYIKHIMVDHYDQMTGCGAIIGAKKMHYVVSEIPTIRNPSGAFYTQILDVDMDHWKNLVKTASLIYDCSIAPMMTSNNIIRIDPPLNIKDTLLDSP